MNKNPIRFASLAAAALLALAAAAHADTLASWPLNNSLAGTSAIAEALSAGDITPGSDLKSLTSNANGYSATGWSTTATPSANAYFEFSVTATSDYYLNLSTLVLNLRSSPTGPANVEIRWSTGGSSWNSLTNFLHTHDSKGYTYEIDAGGLVVESGKTLYFRIFGYGGSSATGTFRLGNGSAMTLSGTAVGTKLPPTISFPHEAESIPVSNKLSVAIGVQPVGSGIASWTFSPQPSGSSSLAGSTFEFTPTAADEDGIFTLTVVASNVYGRATNTLPVTVTEYVPAGAWMTGFETEKDPNNPQSPTDWDIGGRTWSIQQLAFSDKADLPKVGSRACVFGSYNEAFMVSADKMLSYANGCGSGSFLYGEYPGESEPCQPIVVEVATDLASGNWMEVGRVNPSGVTALEKADFDILSSEPVYIRIRTEYVNKSGRVCIDQLTVLPYSKPHWTPFEQYLLNYNVTPGDPGCASQNFWAEGEDAESYLTDDYDEDGFSNWVEYNGGKAPQTNPYDKNSHP